MTCVIVGASSGLGRALAEVFSAVGYDLVIVSSDMKDLTALASDLAIRNQVRIIPVEADLGGENRFLDSISDAADRLGDVRGLLFPVGANAMNDDMTLAPDEVARLTRINFVSIVTIIGRLMPSLLRGGQGVIIGFGSVSAARGRNANMVYAAAKRALAGYFESLRHASVGSGVLVQYYTLGYLETNLSFGIKTLFPKASVKELSKHVVKNLDKDFGVKYHPWFWRYVCLIVLMVPWRVFRHLKF